jgi:hypothetical protein
MNDAAGPRTEAGKTLLKTVDYHIDSDEGDGCQWLHLGGKPCNCGLVEAIQDIEQEATRRDSPPDAEQPLSDLEQRQNEARRRDRQAHYDKGFSDGSRATAANAEALTRDQDAAVLALREALARWLPLSQNPSIAEEWPDKYLDLVWGPNGDKANTYGQLRADLRLLSDHSAAAKQIEDEIREPDSGALEERLGQVYAENRGRGLTQLAIAELCDEFLDRSGAMLGRVRQPYRSARLATQQPAEGGDS